MQIEGVFINAYALLVAGVVTTLCILWLGWRSRILWKNFLFSLVRRRGRDGEEVALKLLQKNGYEIIQSQLPLSGHCMVDDQLLDFDVRVDYLVERDGRKYLAEVKTGDAANPKNIATRRQLYEYASLSHSETVLLVDATSKRVMAISFNNK